LTLDSPPSLVIGTRNRKKGAELAELLAPHGFQVATLDDFPDAIDVVEDGDSFAANAALKATQQARHLGRWVLADDSGLEVDALGGKPGIFSARFATVAGLSEAGSPVAGLSEAGSPGSQTPATATDDENNLHLLKQLGNTPLEKRTARYVCHVTVADPTGAIRAESRGECRGRIRFDPAGTNGFGYDPLFEVVEYHRTFGELGSHVKRAISHRSRALRAIVPKLLEMRDAGF
jgi:XTP/dITP diphosphohydrolase